MACPFFLPFSPLPLTQVSEAESAGAPLGDVYGGRCAADPEAQIEGEMLRRYCNFGRARGHCARAAQAESDAVRFLIQSENGDLVRVAWALDMDHHPVAVGSREIASGELLQPEAGTRAADPLTMQLHARAASYLRHRREVGGAGRLAGDEGAGRNAAPPHP